jgi:hypothetical protein
MGKRQTYPWAPAKVLFSQYALRGQIPNTSQGIGRKTFANIKGI